MMMREPAQSKTLQPLVAVSKSYVNLDLRRRHQQLVVLRNKSNFQRR